jgi:hypothetical protein
LHPRGTAQPSFAHSYCTLCTLIVSKAELLDGIEDDDDEIEPTELPINAETFEFDDLTVSVSATPILIKNI